MTECLACTAETNNGLALCDLCRRKVEVVLDFLPIYFRNLTRWRPGRAGSSRRVPSSHPPAGAFPGHRDNEGSDTISRALSEAGADLTKYAGKLVHERVDLQLPDRDHEADTAADTCSLLASNLTTIANLDWAGEFVRNVSTHEDRLRRLTEDVVPGWYAGACRRCSAPTHVVPGLTWVKCTTCGVSTYARDHLDTILEEARDWIARPTAIAAAIVALLDGEQSTVRLHKRISKWGERGPRHGGIQFFRRRDNDGDAVGPKLFRFGDVLDHLTTDGPTALIPNADRPADLST